jgi:hypothetical protein
MNRITEQFMTYRECARHVWNTYFRFLDDGTHQFRNVDDELFAALALTSVPLSVAASYRQGIPCPFLIVHPTIHPNGTPALYAREDTNRTWRWTPLVLQSAVLLHFIAFFDWADDGVRDWRYYRARVQGYPADPTLIGSDLLLDIFDAEIQLIE